MNLVFAQRKFSFPFPTLSVSAGVARGCFETNLIEPPKSFVCRISGALARAKRKKRKRKIICKSFSEEKARKAKERRWMYKEILIRRKKYHAIKKPLTAAQKFEDFSFTWINIRRREFMGRVWRDKRQKVVEMKSNSLLNGKCGGITSVFFSLSAKGCRWLERKKLNNQQK